MQFPDGGPGRTACLSDQSLPLEALAGLKPRARACVGAGYSREELKDALLRQGLGFTAGAITTVQELCLELVKSTDGRERMLSGPSRQEVLRQLLSERRISEILPELRELRRGGAFFRRIDEALQAGRSCFAHEEELRVVEARLRERLGTRLLRTELAILSTAYEAWLESEGYLDPPLLMKRAIAALDLGMEISLPETIYLFSTQAEESLELELWDRIARRCELVRVSPRFARAEAPQKPVFRWERWHTLDDASERLAETELDFERDVVLIPDTGETRRSLGRALGSRGIPLADPRDPTRLKWEEGLKWALLPLQAVTSRFERSRVIAYLRGFQLHPELPGWIEEINARGIRNGLESYAGGFLSNVHSRLGELEERFSARMTAAELGEAHVTFLRESIPALAPAQTAQAGTHAELGWLLPLFESLWKALESDAKLVGRISRKAPPLYWQERLTLRIAETPAPVERLRPESGLRLFRLYQASFFRAKRVFVLGAPADWLSSERVGSYWLNDRERETLSAEFAVRSRIQARGERLAVLREWISGADEVVFLDAAYACDGRERESILPLLRELGVPLEEGEDRGAHPRWAASYRAQRPLPPQRVELPPLESPDVTATALDNYSRCGLFSLARDRWRLKDTRDPDHDPWVEAKGTILHEAVRVFVAGRDETGNFLVSEEEAVAKAWEAHRARGLLRGKRIQRLTRSRMVEWLRAFREKEREYFERARTKVLALDDRKLRLELPEGVIVGKPDRIDEHPEGLFVVDYKTSSSLPNGREMADLGYRLQLPFYALAAERELGKPVIGMQFIELTRRAGRGHGIFLKQYNGKTSGSLTQTTANSKSLMTEPREEIWRRLEEGIRKHLAGYRAGIFEATPKLQEKECLGCFAFDLCGRGRKLEELEGPEEGGPA
jgi:RecB family exonuclease